MKKSNLQMNKIALRIADRREKLNYTYKELSLKTDISASTLQRYEKGGIGNISIDKFEVLAKALECSPAYLMCWTDNIFGNSIPGVPISDILDQSTIETIRSLSDEELVRLQEYIEFLKFKKEK